MSRAQSGGYRSRSSAASSAGRSSKSSASGPLTDGELEKIGQDIGRNATERFGSLREALRTIPTAERGCISRPALRSFLKEQGYTQRLADQVFERVDVTKDGSVDVKVLKSLCTPNGGTGAANEGTSPQSPNLEGGSPRRASSSPKKNTFAKMDEDRSISASGDDGQGRRSKVADLLSKSEGASLDEKPSPSNRKLPEQERDQVVKEKRPKRASSASASSTSTRHEQHGPTTRPRARLSTQDVVHKTAQGHISEKELNRVMELFGVTCSARHASVHEAYRKLDVEHQGHLNREVFRAQVGLRGFDSEVADKVFDKIDDKKTGEISYNTFFEKFGSYVQPGNELPGVEANKQSLAVSRDFAALGGTMEKSKTMAADGDMDNIVKKISQLVETRHGSVRKGFLSVTPSCSAHVEREDAHLFFKKYGFSGDNADRFFDHLDSEGKGVVPTCEFRSHFARHIDSGDSSCKLWGHAVKDTNAFDSQTTYGCMNNLSQQSVGRPYKTLLGGGSPRAPSWGFSAEPLKITRAPADPE